MTHSASAVIRGRIVVEAPVDKAFSVFTERLGDFKPPEHNLLATPIAETIFEPRVSGRIYNRVRIPTDTRQEHPSSAADRPRRQRPQSSPQ